MPKVFPNVVETWLDDFADHDRARAAKLYQTLSFVTNTDFEVGIRRLLEDVLEQAGAPVAVFAVRGLAYEKRTKTHYLGALGDRERKPMAMIADDPGSEGRLAHLLSILANFASGSLLSHPTINEMAEAGCRTIVFVDDLLGSGRRMRAFANHFYEHPTIRSWISLKHISAFLGLGFAGTSAGLRRAQWVKLPHFTVQLHRAAPTIGDAFEPTEVDGIRDLCFTYAPRTSRAALPLGYHKTACLMIFAHACPNNAPAILWASKAGSWHALFPERLVPAELLLGAGMRPTPAWPTRPSSEDSNEAEHSKARDTAMILRLSRRKSHPATQRFRLSIVTGLPLTELRDLLARCVRAGLIDSHGRTTAAGVLELSRLSALRPPSRRSPTPYFPKQLRPRRI